MRRSEFIKLWADTVEAGRKKNFPDMRPSEAAVARMHDEKTGSRQWAKYRTVFAPLTIEQTRAVLTE